jgi:4-hydroxythreonine-4-phosphate dehydrogenase
MSTQVPIIGISVGDLNGIGLEVIMKTFANNEMLELCTPVIFGSAKTFGYHRKALDLEQFHFQQHANAKNLLPGKVNLVNCWQEEVRLEFGKPDKEVGKYALKSLDFACKAFEEGDIHALVTAPINKETIQSEQFQFTGHTDYLEARYKGKSTMLLISEEMRMALQTVHIPLSEVPKTINKDLLVHRLKTLSRSLEHDFHIKKGKIAVLALNPHAGDGGVIGMEDSEVISPAVQQAFAEGVAAFGPYPADSFFGSGKHKQFDAILAMYHDQGLTPFKALSFGQGVNYTAGLDIIRTSPDHGTGFEIAGKNLANESSFRESVYLAIDLVRKRNITQEISENPLTIKTRNKER